MRAQRNEHYGLWALTSFEANYAQNLQLTSDFEALQSVDVGEILLFCFCAKQKSRMDKAVRYPHLSDHLDGLGESLGSLHLLLHFSTALLNSKCPASSQSADESSAENKSNAESTLATVGAQSCQLHFRP
jgi:hypothetical protein